MEIEINNKIDRRLFLKTGIVLICGSIPGCGKKNPFDTELPPYVPSAPEVVEITGNYCVLETYLWRDFMPICPPDGKPLVALVYIKPLNIQGLPEDLNADKLWVINNEEIWETNLSDEQGQSDIQQLTRIARNGPKWEININVDVVVRLIHNNKSYYLKAFDQPIHATY